MGVGVGSTIQGVLRAMKHLNCRWSNLVAMGTLMCRLMQSTSCAAHTPRHCTRNSGTCYTQRKEFISVSLKDAIAISGTF